MGPSLSISACAPELLVESEPCDFTIILIELNPTPAVVFIKVGNLDIVLTRKAIESKSGLPLSFGLTPSQTDHLITGGRPILFDSIFP